MDIISPFDIWSVPVNFGKYGISDGSMSENPVVGPRASGFVTGKDGEADDNLCISSIQPNAVQSQSKPLEARSDFSAGSKGEIKKTARSVVSQNELHCIPNMGQCGG